MGKYSQYEEEDEYVLPCLSYFEIIGRKREFNINIYMLRLNINMRSQTLEELRENSSREGRVHELPRTHTCPGSGERQGWRGGKRS